MALARTARRTISTKFFGVTAAALFLVALTQVDVLARGSGGRGAAGRFGNDFHAGHFHDFDGHNFAHDFHRHFGHHFGHHEFGHWHGHHFGHWRSGNWHGATGFGGNGHWSEHMEGVWGR